MPLVSFLAGSPPKHQNIRQCRFDQQFTQEVRGTPALMQFIPSKIACVTRFPIGTQVLVS